MDEADKASAKDTLMGVLTYVDSPFKLFVVLALAVAGFVGYFIYSNQALLIGAYQKSQELPSMNESKYDDTARLLFQQTGATVVSIMKVDPILGKRSVARVYLKDGSRFKEMDGHTIPLFNNNPSNNKDVIALMAGEVPCGEYTTPQSEIGVMYVNQGVRYMCRVSVPPSPNEFIGQVSVGWESKPDKDMSNFLIIAAEMLAKRK
jgi:hypothetical protein